MLKTSAGILLYRKRENQIEVLLVHPGGPFFAKKDEGVWSIPKGEVDGEEDLLAAAKREFEEEVGFAPQGDFIPLGTITQKSGKVVHAWALLGDCDPASIICRSMVTLEWPLDSGEKTVFPEVDRAAFFTLEEARKKLNPAQVEFLERLQTLVSI